MDNSRVIIALDFNNLQETLDFVKQLQPQRCQLKVGKELFTAYGPKIIYKLHEFGFKIFLDLKFHDIPTTVYKAIRVAADLGVWMVNVHASGGREMLTQARQAILDSKHKPLLIAVTILTSLNAAAVAEIGYKLPLHEQILHLAKLSYECGLDGVVCSAYEANEIKKLISPNFLTITPGIRLTEDKMDDQIRIMTPQDAVANGADYLVIGRPITKAQYPLQILTQINSSINI